MTYISCLPKMKFLLAKLTLLVIVLNKLINTQSTFEFYSVRKIKALIRFWIADCNSPIYGTYVPR